MPLVDIVRRIVWLMVWLRRVCRTRLVAKPGTLLPIWLLPQAIATNLPRARSISCKTARRAWPGAFIVPMESERGSTTRPNQMRH